jgi:hypothetical protein
MKSALSLILTVCLVASALPVMTQAQVEGPGAFDLRGPASMDGPLARAMTREAVRLAATAREPTSVAEDVQQGGKSGRSDWSRVRALEPGIGIVLTVCGFPPGKRHVVNADESRLTVLNVTDPAIPPAVASVLIDTTWNHPDYFGKAQQGGTFRLNRHVRLAPDGVFMDDRRVVELGQVVEQVERDGVAEVSELGRATRRGLKWGSLIGTGAGLTIGLLIQIPYCRQHSCDSQGGLITPLITMLSAGIGTGLGALIGAGYRTRDVIYRAPSN